MRPTSQTHEVANAHRDSLEAGFRQSRCR